MTDIVVYPQQHFLFWTVKRENSGYVMRGPLDASPSEVSLHLFLFLFLFLFLLTSRQEIGEYSQTGVEIEEQHL